MIIKSYQQIYIFMDITISRLVYGASINITIKRYLLSHVALAIIIGTIMLVVYFNVKTVIHPPVYFINRCPVCTWFMENWQHHREQGKVSAMANRRTALLVICNIS